MHRLVHALNPRKSPTADAATSSPSSSTSSVGDSSQSHNNSNDSFRVGESQPDMSQGLDESALEQSQLADLVAKYGSSTSTAWLEADRYHTWRPSKAIPQSSFTPVQGYLHSDSWVFGWGNPIVSDPKALKPTVQAFISFVESKGMRCVYCCADVNLEEILAGMGWSTVSCINEDIVDPEHVVELTSDNSEGRGSMVKDLKKNLRRAERAKIDATEIQRNDWSEAVRKEIEDGVAAWKKSRRGLQLAAVGNILLPSGKQTQSLQTSFDPFLDFDHRRYWMARSEGKVNAFLLIISRTLSTLFRSSVFLFFLPYEMPSSSRMRSPSQKRQKALLNT